MNNLKNDFHLRWCGNKLNILNKFDELVGYKCGGSRQELSGEKYFGPARIFFTRRYRIYTLPRPPRPQRAAALWTRK
jgi:hypothetical protein